MPTRDEMTIDERRKYMKLMAPRYKTAKRTERSQLLSEMEQVSKLHRKQVIRLLNGQSLDRKKRSTLRSRSYGLEVERVVLRMARHVARFGVLVLTAEIESQLATISPATVQRMLRKNRPAKRVYRAQARTEPIR